MLQEEDIYTIESLVAKKGSKYLVKWENFPHDQNTWEPRSAIPPFIVKVSDVIVVVVVVFEPCHILNGFSSPNFQFESFFDQIKKMVSQSYVGE